MEEITELDNTVPNNNTSIASQHTSTKHSLIPKTNIYLILLALFGMTYIFTVFVGNVLYTPFTVVGNSMQPTLNQAVIDSDDHSKNDIVYVAKQSNYNREDVVVFWEKSDENYLIKRIVGIPGDTISYQVDRMEEKNGKSYLYYNILINGKILEKTHILEDMYIQIADYSTYNLYQDIMSNTEIKLGNGEYFCLGDNRNNSFDSRFFGSIKYDDILGNVRFVTHYGEGVIIAYIRSWFTNEI